MPKTFRMIARAQTCAVFRQTDALTVTVQHDGSPINITYRTRYLPQQGWSLPGDMFVDVTGLADSHVAVGERFVQLAQTMTLMTTLAANAAIGVVTPEVIYDATPGTAEREYFQRFHGPDNIPFFGRIIDPDDVLTILSAIDQSRERDRLVRAMSQYQDALRLLKPGQEVLCVGTLFMGVEALKTSALREHILARDISREELAQEWGWDGKKRLNSFLDAEARHRLIFQSDTTVYKRALDVSDHFEHGISNFPKLYEPARDSLIKTAYYLREAIFDVAELSKRDRIKMNDRGRIEPRGMPGIEAYVRGVLKVQPDHKSINDGNYPCLDWTIPFGGLSEDVDTGVMSVDISHNLSWNSNPAAEIKDFSVTFFDAGRFTPV